MERPSFGCEGHHPMYVVSALAAAAAAAAKAKVAAEAMQPSGIVND